MWWLLRLLVNIFSLIRANGCNFFSLAVNRSLRSKLPSFLKVKNKFSLFKKSRYIFITVKDISDLRTITG